MKIMKEAAENRLTFMFFILVAVLCVAFNAQQLGIPVRQYTFQRILEIVFFIAPLIWLLVDLCRGKIILPISLRTLVAYNLVIVWMVVVSVKAEFTLRSLQDAGLFACIFAVIFWLGSSCPNSSFTKLLPLILIPASLYIVQFIPRYVELWAFKFGNYHSIPNFSNVRQFNHLQVLLIPILLLLANGKQIEYYSNLIAAIAKIIAVGWLALLFFTGGRAALLALITSYLTMVYCFDRSDVLNRKQIYLVGWALAAYFLLFVLPPIFMEWNVSIKMARASSSGRAELWLFSVSNIIECIWGCGGQSFAVLTSRFFELPFGHPHNIVLAFAIEYGLLFFFPASYILYRSVKVMRSTIYQFSPLDCSILVGVIAFFINSLFSGTQFNPIAGCLFALYCGYLLSAVAPKKVIGIEEGVSKKLLTTALFTLLITLTIISFLVTFSDLFIYFEVLNAPGYFYPRFYDRGNFFV